MADPAIPTLSSPFPNRPITHFVDSWELKFRGSSLITVPARIAAIFLDVVVLSIPYYFVGLLYLPSFTATVVKERDALAKKVAELEAKEKAEEPGPELSKEQKDHATRITKLEVTIGSVDEKIAEAVAKDRASSSEKGNAAEGKIEPGAREQGQEANDSRLVKLEEGQRDSVNKLDELRLKLTSITKQIEELVKNGQAFQVDKESILEKLEYFRQQLEEQNKLHLKNQLEDIEEKIKKLTQTINSFTKPENICSKEEVDKKLGEFMKLFEEQIINLQKEVLKLRGEEVSSYDESSSLLDPPAPLPQNRQIFVGLDDKTEDFEDPAQKKTNPPDASPIAPLSLGKDEKKK